jgi:vacuolar-type H+-ATPase subunit I/STV1
MIEHGKVIKQVAEEKRKVDQKYASLMDDMQKFMDKTKRDVIEKNYAKYNDEKVKSNNEKKLQAVNAELEELKKLKAEIAILQDCKNMMKKWWC